MKQPLLVDLRHADSRYYITYISTLLYSTPAATTVHIHDFTTFSLSVAPLLPLVSACLDPFGIT
ncbi:MAG TPA: hypothetical protein GX717_02855 [Clostridiaceae bacterium]|nr:hypothetical protein [Clostridiaceae bacterium]